jgi:hypothetical protein
MHHSVNLPWPHSASALAAVAAIAEMKRAIFPAATVNVNSMKLTLVQAGGWYRGNEVSMTQVLSTGQTATHCGSSK